MNEECTQMHGNVIKINTTRLYGLSKNEQLTTV